MNCGWQLTAPTLKFKYYRQDSHMNQYLPDFRNLSNEVVFTLTLAASIIGEIVAVLNGIDWESGLIALLPVVTGLIARLKVYGPDVIGLLGDANEQIVS